MLDNHSACLKNTLKKSLKVQNYHDIHAHDEWTETSLHTCKSPLRYLEVLVLKMKARFTSGELLHLVITSVSHLFMQNKSYLCDVCFPFLSGHATDLIFIHAHRDNGYFPLTLPQPHKTAQPTANNGTVFVCI